MANVKISGMTPGAALTGAELFEMVQGGSSFSTTGTALKTLVGLGNFTISEAVGSSGLVITGATQTVDHPAISATQTWNAGGVTFTAIKLNVTSTASAAASKLIDLQVGGVSQMSVTKGGAMTLAAGLTVTTTTVLLTTSGALANGAAAQTATMTNAPTAGNPTKWISINDNGTTRYIPTWT